MKVHHLNCGSMRFPGAPLVCHVQLLETARGLVLVDTGFGLQDTADPAGRIGPYRRVIRPVLDEAETALRQVEALGFAQADVRHVVLTHFDADHAGGLADFPDADVHVTAAEARGAVHHPTRRERIRYSARQWAHGPRLVEHDADGEAWRGFAAAKELTGIAPGIVLVSLPGHTRGHACVAVDTGSGWLLHAGDAFYSPGTLDGSVRVPRSVSVQETLVAYDRSKVRANHARLGELYRRREPDLEIFSAHDPGLFARARGR